jgi:hypothetical protein
VRNFTRTPVLLPVLLLSAGCAEPAAGPRPGAAVADRADRLIGATVLDDSAWKRADDARVARLRAGTGASSSCSAVPLAGKWLLSARHCWAHVPPDPQALRTL